MTSELSDGSLPVVGSPGTRVRLPTSVFYIKKMSVPHQSMGQLSVPFGMGGMGV